MTKSDQVSFLPDDYLDRKVQRRTNTICAVLSLVIMFAIGSAFTLTDRMIHRAEKEHAIIETQYADAGRQIEQVERLQIKQRQMARQAELSSSLLEKVPRSFILAEITNALPAGVSLLDFTLDSKRHVASAQAAPTAPTRGAPAANTDSPTNLAGAEPLAYDVTMKLTGLAASDVQVAQYINHLSNSKLMKDVNLVVSDEFMEAKEKVRKFQIEMTLDPDAEVHPADQSDAAAPAAGSPTAGHRGEEAR